MTALPPLTDGQWDDLRHRFPNHGTDVVVRISAGWCLARRDVDALRAAGVWCEHEADPSCADEGVRCVIRDAKEVIDPDFEMPGTAPSITEAAAAVHGGRPKPHTYAVGVSSTRPSELPKELP